LIFQYFSKAWENAFEFSKLLRQRYEEQFDYEKLCGLLSKQAELCKNVLQGERYFSNYYLVGFYGKGFSKLLQVLSSSWHNFKFTFIDLISSSV
jgi:dedicator of cytokinesis protein 3